MNKLLKQQQKQKESEKEKEKVNVESNNSKVEIVQIEDEPAEPEEIILIDLEEPIIKKKTEPQKHLINETEEEEGIHEFDPELKALINQSNEKHMELLPNVNNDKGETIEIKFKLELSEKLKRFHFNEIIIKCYKSSIIRDLLSILGPVLNLEPSKLVLAVKSILIYPSTSLKTIKDGTFIDVFADKNDFDYFSLQKDDSGPLNHQGLAAENTNANTFNIRISQKESITVEICPHETFESLLQLIKAKSNNPRLNSLFFDGEELNLKQTIMKEAEIEDGDMLEARIKA